MVNSLVIRCCHGWSIPGHLTLIWRLGHPPFDRDRLQARSICLSGRFIIYVALSSLSPLVLVGECPSVTCDPLISVQFFLSCYYLFYLIILCPQLSPMFCLFANLWIINIPVPSGGVMEFVLHSLPMELHSADCTLSVHHGFGLHWPPMTEIQEPEKFIELEYLKTD